MLCHQSSSGPDVIIASELQMHTQAPSGPRNPQKRTAAPRSVSVPAKVVARTVQPQERPATAPPR
jgi:hypothetical protein